MNVTFALDELNERIKRLESKNPNFPKHVLDVLSNLIQNYNELAVKLAAAERVLARQDPAVFEAYLKEKESAARELKLRAPAEVLAPFRSNP